MADFKVLIPLDGSALAEQSLRYLGELKRFDGADLMLLSVVDESEDFGALTSREASDREFNVLTSYLNDVSRDIQLHLRINVSTKVVRGAPAHCILTEAKEYQPDLIMVSTHGRSGLSRWRFGSVADKVIRGAENNVLVIGPKAAEPNDWRNEDSRPSFRSILVPLDGSALAEEALPVAKRCAETFNTQLHFVRVVPIPTTDVATGHGAYTPHLLDDMVEGAKTYLSTTAGRLKSAVNTRTDVLIGQAASQLAEYIASNHVDLVIMTSHGRSGFGSSSGNAPGVHGQAPSGIGLLGSARTLNPSGVLTGGTGVKGETGDGIGVYGTSVSGRGLVGESPGGVALDVVGKARFRACGAGIAPTKSDGVTIPEPLVTAASHVSITFMSDPGEIGTFWVEREPGEGFTLHISKQTKKQVAFTYLVVEPGA